MFFSEQSIDFPLFFFAPFFLKIDVKTTIPEASLPYNSSSNLVRYQTSLDLIALDGYVVDNQMMINFPILGKLFFIKSSQKSTCRLWE